MVELKVLRLVVDGKSNKEIAQLLDRSVRTIEEHRSHIMRKLAARNAIELVERAIQMGLVKLPAHRIRGGDRRKPPKSTQKRT